MILKVQYLRNPNYSIDRSSKGSNYMEKDKKPSIYIILENMKW